MLSVHARCITHVDVADPVALPLVCNSTRLCDRCERQCERQVRAPTRGGLATQH